MCPGQGAQKVGMGKDLAERFPAARETFERIDATLGVSLSRIMWNGPESELTLTHNTQPAILAHSVAVWAVVAERLAPTMRAGAGHSLGEYSAYVAAGALTPEAAAGLVRRRGELMYEAGTRRPGAMAAVLGLATGEVEAACHEASTETEIAVAARDAGMEVVYQGIRLTPEQIAAAARDEDVDVIGLSILSGSHLELVPETLRRLREADVQAPVVVGGIIPPADARVLETAGIARIYTPKNYELAAIMSDVAELAADYRRERTKTLH